MGWRFDRRRWAYWRRRARRSSPPHVVVRPGALEPESSTRGGYEAGVADDWLMGGETGDGLKERDSSSWKYSVGRVEPLVKFTAMDPSVDNLVKGNQTSLILDTTDAMRIG